MATTVEIPLSWCQHTDLSTYMTSKGYTLTSCVGHELGSSGKVKLTLDEDLDSGQKTALADMLEADLNTVTFPV